MAQILLIDDEEMVRMTVRQILEMAGHSVTEAHDGEQGIKMLQESLPELVISDLIMPNKEGVETIAEIRGAHPHLPIIAMSGGGRIGATDFLEVAKKIGANRTLPKPFEPEDVLAVVDDLLAAGDTPKAQVG